MSNSGAEPAITAQRAFSEEDAMDLRFTSEEQAFRREVRAFIAENLDKETHAALTAGHRATKEQIVAWQRTLNKKGWATVDWPKEYGGTGWDIIRRHIFRDEIQSHPAPEPLAFGVYMLGPVIITFGTAEQKKRFLPRIANLDDWWCQGFSEPGSGSDLASLKTAARREGNCYIVNGQKTWTTYAQYADWIFCLVRTDAQAAKLQEGISFLLIDMKSPGVTCRPIVTIDGGAEINEVFFDDVKVPVENLVGTENRGWDCAKFLLSNERVNTARIGATKERLRRLKKFAATVEQNGRPLIEDQRFAEKLADLEIELKALEITQLRVLANEYKNGKGKPDPASSVLKLRGTELQQRVTELTLEAAGPHGLVGESRDAPLGHNEEEIAPEWMRLAAPTYFNTRKTTIYGGSNEIQRNIIAKQILGL
jgi:pimeloyl-CoA dehydrogenase large subunit